jgi:GNAT superfamily N-acetyltransferase
MIKIVPYDNRYKSDFEKLNRAWIEEYFKMEHEDLLILQDPETHVLQKNGEIFFAVSDQEVIGTAAMISFADGVYELSKMSVKKNFQGKGIGKLLLNRCINFAKEQNANAIFLLTNDILKPALNLYLSCGFVKDRYDDQRYERGNTKMTLTLGDI